MRVLVSDFVIYVIKPTTYVKLYVHLFPQSGFITKKLIIKFYLCMWSDVRRKISLVFKLEVKVPLFSMPSGPNAVKDNYGTFLYWC